MRAMGIRRPPIAFATVDATWADPCRRLWESSGLRLPRRARRKCWCFLLESGMPLFGSIFSPKKTPPRKSASLSNLHSLDRSTRELELGLDYGTPTMNLAGQNLKFENGQWVADTVISGGVDRRETQRLRKRNQQLEEENNLLRLKVDILLDMLSETTAESHLKDKELDELKIINRRRK
nr:protein chibby homolog 1 isoform X1 [Myodes glareolus]